MSPSPFDDKLPESFFEALYPTVNPDAAGNAEVLNASTAEADSGLAQRLIESSPGAVFCLDRQLHCRLANRAARAWYRQDVANPAFELPQPINHLLAEPLLEALVPYLSAALRGMEMELHDDFEHPRLGPRKLFIRVQPDHVGHGVKGVFLHLQDLTGLTQPATPAQSPELAPHHEAHLRMLADGLRDAAIFFLDAQGQVNDWTPSAERLLGYTAEQILHRSVRTFTPPNLPTPADGDPMLLGMEHAALLGQSETPGLQQRANGTTFWANTLLTALHDDDTGELQGYACLMRDVTEVKRLIDMLQELNHTLEARVEDRTQQLQDINQDLEAFSYSVSHDLRAPLRHITSYVELLREDLGPLAGSDTLKDLDHVAHAAQHMGQLIEGLLAFSRLGRAALQRRNVAMGDLLQSSLNRVQHDPGLRRPDSEVVWNLPQSLPNVQGDGLLLSQVWDNLLANALKYSRARQPANLAVGWQAQAGEHVFWVRDDGVGFDPRRADKLFGVFQRLHRASEFEGTGIGLALCRRIVERHGGRIWAESQLGAGSTFYFALPAGDATEPAASQAAG